MHYLSKTLGFTNQKVKYHQIASETIDEILFALRTTYLVFLPMYLKSALICDFLCSVTIKTSENYSHVEK